MDIIKSQGKQGYQQKTVCQQNSGSSAQQPSAEPFPQICIKEQNPRYVQMLKADMVSFRSEFTSLSQYSYQSCILWQKEPELAHMLQQFSETEMRHLHILGKMVSALGGNPSYSVMQRNRIMVWNGRMISYIQMPLPIVHQNIAAKKFSIERYKEQLAAIRDENIAEILRRIVKDEEIHLAFFVKYTEKG